MASGDKVWWHSWATDSVSPEFPGPRTVGQLRSLPSAKQGGSCPLTQLSKGIFPELDVFIRNLPRKKKRVSSLRYYNKENFTLKDEN